MRTRNNIITVSKKQMMDVHIIHINTTVLIPIRGREHLYVFIYATVITQTHWSLSTCWVFLNVPCWCIYISLCLPVTVRVVPGKLLLHSKLGAVNLKWYSAESLSLRSVILRVERPLSVSMTWTRPANWESLLRSSGCEAFCHWPLRSGLNQNLDSTWFL